MPVFPSGSVTLVFTDIEGSSALWEAHNKAFSPVLEAHNRIMRAAAAKWNGFEVKTEGDAFFLVFSEAADAVNFAVSAQLSLVSHDWSSVLSELNDLRVRIGMHTGEPILSAHPDGTADYFGPVVNRAARVGGAGYGGQILVSDATKAAAEPGDVTFENLGRHRLKGVGEETLWQVVCDGIPDRFPALKTLARANHNLPTSQTPFIGREAEIIGQGEHKNEFTSYAFDNNGSTNISIMYFKNNQITIVSERERFKGEIKAMGKIIEGKWEKPSDKDWEYLMDIKLEKEV
ncbi:adenylate/guanylate cyclase domain-containing protein [bacterium]|nr:MAG: adenylate/guanylate cyclase domain-containing protein [bacterium]